MMAILVVDDNKDIRDLIKLYLANACDVEVLLAASAAEATELLSEDLDLILLDIVMPDKDGITICEEIKARPEFADTPIIFVTNQSELRTLERAYAAGAIDFIRKPFSKIELRARVCAMYQLSKEIKKRKQREEELKKMSMVDGLTGIANRRYFDELFEREWQVSRRSKSALSVILIDVDFFKPYNDSYGHLAGDEVLKEIATTIDTQLHRATDNVFRYGGEEFVVLLPGANLETALTIANNIRKQVENLEIPHLYTGHMPHFLTISAGVSRLVNDGEHTAEELFRQADIAMYNAKQTGKNKVVAYNNNHEVAPYAPK